VAQQSLFELNGERDDMANKRILSDTDGISSSRKQSKVGANYDAPFVGYINVTLSEQQKAAFDTWSLSQSPWDVLASSVADGVNLSLKIEPRSSGFLASATQRRVGSPNAGLVVTARGKEAHVALYRLLFMLAYLGRSERWTDTQGVSDPDRW